MAEFSAKEFERLDPGAAAGPKQFQADPSVMKAFDPERLGALGPDVIKKMDLKQFENPWIRFAERLNGEQVG